MRRGLNMLLRREAPINQTNYFLPYLSLMDGDDYGDVEAGHDTNDAAI